MTTLDYTQLGHEHIGKIVTVTTGATSVTGLLASVQHETSLAVEELIRGRRVKPYRRSTRVCIAGLGWDGIEIEGEVTVREPNAGWFESNQDLA